MRNFVFIFLSASVMFAANAGRIDVIEPVNGKCVPILTDAQKSFFAMPPEKRREIFTNEVFRSKEMGYPSEHVPGEKWPRRACYPKAVKFAWKALEGVHEYKVVVKEVRSGAIVADETVKGDVVYLDNFKAGFDYRWTVVGGGKKGDGRFKTEDIVPRVVRFPNMANVRDLGGWRGLKGRRVKQGKIFRSAGMNANADPVRKVPGENWISGERGEYIRWRFGIKTDLDIRSDEECLGMTGSPLGPTIKWVHCPFRAYGGMQEDIGRAAFKKVFPIFLDEKNYPIDFHCISGADRTGSLSYVLMALLGASDDFLALDWETSGFWTRGVGFSHKNRFDKLADGFVKNYPGATTRERVEGYVLSLGFTMRDIEKFRKIMLEK